MHKSRLSQRLDLMNPCFEIYKYYERHRLDIFLYTLLKGLDIHVEARMIVYLLKMSRAISTIKLKITLKSF